MDGIQPYKGDAHPPSTSRPAGERVTAIGQSGGRQNHLQLLEGAATPILGGAGRRGSPGHHYRRSWCSGFPRSTW